MRRQLGIHILQYPVSPRKVAIVFESWGQALEDSLFFAEGQPTGPMCNLNSEVSELCLNHLCFSMADFISPLY